MTDKYVYEGLLSYFDIINLNRWVSGLCVLSRALKRNNAVSMRWVDAVVFHADHFEAGTIDPRYTAEEKAEHHARKIAFDKLSEAEKEQAMEQESEELRQKIESGEFDIWGDSIEFADSVQAEKLISQSVNWIENKYLKACSNDHFIEKIIPKAIEAVKQKNYNTITGYLAVLRCWDYARMHYEGEPPYKIRFSQQVVNALGIDPTMESIKHSTMNELTERDKQKYRKYSTVAKKLLPEFSNEVKYIEKTLKL